MVRQYVMRECRACDGTGRVPGLSLYPGTGAFRPPVPCRVCGGSGQVRKYPPKRKTVGE